MNTIYRLEAVEKSTDEVNTQFSTHKLSNSTRLTFLLLLALLLAACAAPVTPSPASPAGQTDPAHAPIILRPVDRNEIVDGFQYLYKDIYFTDPDGDASSVTYRVVASSLSYPLDLPAVPVETPADEQKVEALFTEVTGCWQRIEELAYEIRIQDQAGNLSEPVEMRFSCTTPPAVDAISIFLSGLGIAAVVALFLGLGFWLLFRKRPEERVPALRSTLLLFCLLVVMQFVGSILHEGGHALYLVWRGFPAMVYAHPFAFPGYARPFIDNSTWFNILGSLTTLLVSPFLSLPFWKRRSTALLPLVMLFPLFAFGQSFNVLGVGGADFRNPVEYNGVSPIPFTILGTLFLATGLLLTFAILPLLGLDPKDKRALFVLPGAVSLLGILSLPVACFIVPYSPIDREYFLAQEIVPAIRMVLPIQVILWFLLALLYVTIYRWLYPHLPAWLRTETVTLAWKDLRIPAALAVICVILGLIIIT